MTKHLEECTLGGVLNIDVVLAGEHQTAHSRTPVHS